MTTKRVVRLPGALTGRRAPIDSGYIHYCAESCVHISPLRRAILAQLARGCSNKEIGMVLQLQPKTVKNHLTDIYALLNVADRVQLALLVVASGLA